MRAVAVAKSASSWATLGSICDSVGPVGTSAAATTQRTGTQPSISARRSIPSSRQSNPASIGAGATSMNWSWSSPRDPTRCLSSARWTPAAPPGGPGPRISTSKATAPPIMRSRSRLSLGRASTATMGVPASRRRDSSLTEMRLNRSCWQTGVGAKLESQKCAHQRLDAIAHAHVRWPTDKSKRMLQATPRD